MSMYLSKLTLHNFMSYSGGDPYEFEFGPACNFLVGNNNCGKSTLLFALEFLSNKGAKIPPISPVNCAVRKGYVSACFVAEDKKDFPKQLQYYINHDATGKNTVEVKRPYNLNGCNVCTEKPVVYDYNSCTYENEISEQAIAQLVSPTCIEALIEPGDYADFGTTKVLGKLFGALYSSIEALDLWKDYQEAHDKLARDPSGLPSIFEGVQREINESLEGLFGGATARFDFSHQEVKDFLKGGAVFVDDGNQETDLGSKGSGLQKAFSMAVVQVYARHAGKRAASKLDLCIDEPETWLHPAAQMQFGKVISDIAVSQQVWIATHSPYIIQSYNADRGDHLLIFSEQNAIPRYRSVKMLETHSGGHPSLAQISYEAFGLCTPEYHSELLGHIQAKTGKERLKDLEEYLKELIQKFGSISSKTRCRANRGGMTEVDELLPIYIRNCIDHPEAAGAITSDMKKRGINNQYTQEELEKSIQFLTKIISAKPWEMS